VKCVVSWLSTLQLLVLEPGQTKHTLLPSPLNPPPSSFKRLVLALLLCPVVRRAAARLVQRVAGMNQALVDQGVGDPKTSHHVSLEVRGRRGGGAFETTRVGLAD
jgi:hypothetical protein